MSRQNSEALDWVSTSISEIEEIRSMSDSSDSLRTGCEVKESETVPMELMALFD